MKNFITYTLIALLLAGAGIGIYCSWAAIKGTIDGSKYYTAEEYQAAYDQGYTDGSGALETVEAQNEYLTTLYNQYYSDWKSTCADYEKVVAENNSLTSQVLSFTTTVNDLNTTVDTLNATIKDNEEVIAANNVTILSLQQQVAALQVSEENNTATISSLQSQMSTLQATNNQLQSANEANLSTITVLNSQILSLNSQISELTLQIQNNSTTVSALSSKIADLENSIAYYEQFIANLETDSQVVATFEFDGSVYNVQILTTGSKVSVVDPESTNSVIFNGWTVDGQAVDLNTYIVTTNTKFVADVTYQYLVSFVANDTTLYSGYVVKDNFANYSETPTKTGYEFDGWTINGVDVIDLASYPITADTTFFAKFTQLHTVNFVYEDEVISSQTIRNGELASAVNVTNTEYKTFNGWLLNGTSVDLSTYKIVADIVLTADITYYYDVTFVVDNETYASYIVQSGSYSTLPTDPTMDGYIFSGWSLDGENIIDPTMQIVTQNVSFLAVFIAPYGLFDADTDVMLLSWDELIDDDYITVDNGVLNGGSNKTNLNGVLKINNNITSISASAFSDCSNLTGVEIPSSVIYIYNDAFKYCYNLRYATISEGVQIICPGAFNYCYSLTSLYIPSSVDSFGVVENGDCPSSDSVVFGCSENLKIFSPSAETLIGWGVYSTYISSSIVCAPDYVSSYSEYLEVRPAFSNKTLCRVGVSYEEMNELYGTSSYLTVYVYVEKNTVSAAELISSLGIASSYVCVRGTYTISSWSCDGVVVSDMSSFIINSSCLFKATYTLSFY